MPMDTPPPNPIAPLPPKRGMSTGCIVGLVIGIVTLVGVGVVAILAALAVPAFNQVQSKAKMVRTQVMMKNLQMGIRSYQTEYNRMPKTDAARDPQPPHGELCQGQLLEILLGTDKQQNPREIQFIELPTIPSDGKGPGMQTISGLPTLVDAWGHPMLVLMQDDGSGLPDPEHSGGTLNAEILIWSAGPDGDFATWKDNVTSWK